MQQEKTPQAEAELAKIQLAAADSIPVEQLIKKCEL